MDLKLIFEFINIDELAEFINEQKDFNNWKLRKQFKKAIDGRGSHQKEYHQLAKQYQLVNSELPYRQCLKEAINKAKSELKKD